MAAKGNVMHCIRIIVLCNILVSFASCSSILISHDYDTEVNFTVLKNYDWHPVERSIQMNDLFINRVKDAVNRELDLQGYTLVQEDSDFSIAIHLLERKKTSFTDWGYPAGSFWGGYGYSSGSWYGHSRLSARDYQEGTLILDVLDSAKNELIWRGSATDIVNPNLSPEQRTQQINKAVFLILQKFPP